MAQSNFEERIDTYEIESTNVMTGDRDRIRYLYYQLKMSMAKAKQIDIIVSFLMESGVRMLLNDMKRALDRGVRIRILTGNYLGITQPSALYLIKSELGDRVDLRLYNETSRSFHPKSYILYLPSNGIALCRDMHWAFDKGMFTIGDDFKVIVHPDVESDYLQQYNNKSLYIPENAFFRPDINNLHYHQTHIYGLFKTSGSLVKATGYYKNINMAAEDKTPYGSN